MSFYPAKGGKQKPEDHAISLIRTSNFSSTHEIEITPPNKKNTKMFVKGTGTFKLYNDDNIGGRNHSNFKPNNANAFSEADISTMKHVTLDTGYSFNISALYFA